MGLADLAVSGLQRLAPETAHDIAIFLLRSGLAGKQTIIADPRLATPAFGRTLPHPIGLAAGFDKNADALAGLARLGFAFLEAGTVTPHPQPGNPRPRLFRLPEDDALINRMGFNNRGIDAFATNLGGTGRRPTPIGANLGINKDDADPLIDYPTLVRLVAPHCDYIAINVSSPNTPGLRDLQAADRLAAILDAIARASSPHPPLFVKLSPDLADDTLPELVSLAIERNLAGLIISNTTLARPETLRSAHRNEAGGLSGAPLFARSTRMLAKIRLLAGDRLTLIGVGGIATPEQAFTKLRAGANLVQIYTGFVNQGPAIIPRLVTGLARLLDAYDVQTLADLIGRDADRLAELAP